MTRWKITATCWTLRGRPSSWEGMVDAEDAAAAIAKADAILVRHHHRYEIKAVPAAAPRETV